MSDTWAQIEAEATDAFRELPLRAYSEAMPPPYVGLKPYAPSRAHGACTFGVSHGDALDVDEYEQAHDLEPGLDRIAEHLVGELGKLVRGQPHGLSKSLLAGNPAWPDELAAAARAGKLAHDPLVVMCALALSRTQDDKGNDRWTLFGASHDGPRAAFDGLDEHALAAWAGLDGRKTLVTFEPFARLPADVRAAYLAGELVLLPTPASLVFFEHPRYRELAHDLPRATQIALLHLFPRVEASCAIRIPQSGWLDEHDPAQRTHIVRTHRWQRVARDAGIHGDGMYTDHVSTALFATTPEAIDLYDKPLARNAQIWSGDYKLLLDGPRAEQAAIARAAGIVDAGGRFGYRMYYPPMRAGARELFWHVPLVARAEHERWHGAPLGYVSAERDGAPPLRLAPRLLAREPHRAAATLFERDPGHARHTTSLNARKLLEARELLGAPLPRDLARSLVHCPKHASLETWLADLPGHASDRTRGTQLVAALQAAIAPEEDPGAPIVLGELGTRAFEEQIWNSIASLAHGEFRQKNDADGIRTNRGKHGGPAAKAAHVHAHERRDLEALGDHLHARYRELIAAHGMTGRAECVDHVFRWETDFQYPWMEGWAKNQHAPAERNVVCVIPGANRGEAVVFGDHYDTAYMEDVFYAETGGDALRAPACGADDNHSATTALLLAAERLLPLARAGKLQRDVWLVHLTGEEFPADCLGARALARALVEKRLAFTGEDGRARDVSNVRVAGVFVADMIGHNSDRDRDVFQIAPGEGAGSLALARRAHRANLRWNQLAAQWNRAPERQHAGRAHRMPDGPDRSPPPPFAHLALAGEVRVEWEPRSALYNTDGQIFSDLGIPVVLFMENYDISRKGYHDTHDTLANIDLDYCAALTAIAIEAVADTACALQAP
ncbi:MAG TPA: M28 family peptidase [Kofleriaceae bacterium]|jgi:hypothetical protein